MQCSQANSFTFVSPCSLWVCLGFDFRTSAGRIVVSSLSFVPELIKVSCESRGRRWAECFPGERTASGAFGSNTELSPTDTDMMVMMMMMMMGRVMVVGSNTQTSDITSGTCQQVTACWPSAKAMETRSSSEPTRAKTGEESEGSRVSVITCFYWDSFMSDNQPGDHLQSS